MVDEDTSYVLMPTPMMINYENGYYEGSFREGTRIREGFGTYYYNSSGKYVGDWKDNRRNGRGTCFF